MSNWDHAQTWRTWNRKFLGWLSCFGRMASSQTHELIRLVERNNFASNDKILSWSLGLVQSFSVLGYRCAGFNLAECITSMWTPCLNPKIIPNLLLVTFYQKPYDTSSLTQCPVHSFFVNAKPDRQRKFNIFSSPQPEIGDLNFKILAQKRWNDTERKPQYYNKPGIHN